MTAMPDTGILRVFFPQPLPMHVNIYVVIVDHDALDVKVHGHVVEQFKIGFCLLLQPLRGLCRHHKRCDAGTILLHVRYPKRFDRFIDTKVPLMILGILHRFRAAARADHPEYEDDRDRAYLTSRGVHRDCSIETARWTGQATCGFMHTTCRCLAISAQNF